MFDWFDSIVFFRRRRRRHRANGLTTLCELTAPTGRVGVINSVRWLRWLWYEPTNFGLSVDLWIGSRRCFTWNSIFFHFQFVACVRIAWLRLTERHTIAKLSHAFTFDVVYFTMSLVLLIRNYVLCVCLCDTMRNGSRNFCANEMPMKLTPCELGDFSWRMRVTMSLYRHTYKWHSYDFYHLINFVFVVIRHSLSHSHYRNEDNAPLPFIVVTLIFGILSTNQIPSPDPPPATLNTLTQCHTSQAEAP